MSKKSVVIYKQALRECIAYHNYKWPKHLTSGVMFFLGFRITIEDFKKEVSLYK